MIMTDSQKSLATGGLIGLLLTVAGAGTGVYIYKHSQSDHDGIRAFSAGKGSSSGDTPIIISDGGSNTFVHIRHRERTWKTFGVGGFKTSLNADNWLIADLNDELTYANATISITGLTVRLDEDLLTVEPVVGSNVTCTNNKDAVHCTQSANHIDLAAATVQVLPNIHTPSFNDHKNLFVFIPQ